MSVVLSFDYGGRTELLDLSARYTPLVEPDGNEVFAVLGMRVWPGFMAEAGAAGFRLSVGIGANPLVAKAARPADGCGGALARSRTAGGLVLRVPVGAEAAFMSALPVEALWPLPVRTIKKLRGLGLTTAGDAARVGGRELRARFGPEGALIAAYSRGEDHRRVRALYPPPVIVWALDLKGVRNRGEWTRVLAMGAERITADLRAGMRGYRRLALSLVLADGQTVKAEREYTEGSPDPRRMRARLEMLLSRSAVTAPATEIRVTAGELYRLQSRQIDLFAVKRAGEDVLRQVLGAVNLKYPGKLTRGYSSEATRFRRERMREALLKGL